MLPSRQQILLVLALSLLTAPSYAAATSDKTSAQGQAVGRVSVAADQTAVLQFDPMDTAKAESKTQRRGTALQFADRVRPNLNIEIRDGQPSHGAWRAFGPERRRWRATVDAPNALSLNLAFSNFWLPEGAELSIYDSQGHRALGPYTDADIKSHGELWTPLIIDDSIAIEITVPVAQVPFVSVSLASVQRGFLNPFDAVGSAKSGSCNVDMACPAGDAWRDQGRGVSRVILGGGFLCTGTLINNVAAGGGTRKNYFLTADHCFRDDNDAFDSSRATSAVFYWGYESDTCRTPGSTASGQTLSDGGAVTQTGSQVVANRTGTDFTLLELDDSPPASANVYYVGWDRGSSTPNSGVSIHHPRGHAKRISIEDDGLTIDDRPDPGGENNAYWVVNDWDEGTTEGGSSGSALFAPSGLLIGQLYGGFAACGNNLEDYYGRIDLSWEGASSQTRLRDWLDTEESAGLTLSGTEACSVGSVSINASAASVATGATVSYTAQVAGNTSGYQITWDFNDDGFADAEGATVETHFPSAGAKTVQVTVTDPGNCAVESTHGQTVTGPSIDLTSVGTPTQLCGDGDAVVEPGERWRLPVEFRNSGQAASDAYAVFTAAAGSAKALSEDNGGYSIADETASSCRYESVNIRSTGEPLDITGGNDDGVSVVTLGGFGLSVFGDRVGRVAMSTNGYISLDVADDGGDFSNDCPLPARPDRGSLDATRLMPMHDDLIPEDMYYQYFENCPRSPDAGGTNSCHVFQWDGVGFFRSNQSPDGDFEVVAIVYQDGDIVYQYAGDNPRQGASATLGLQTGGREAAATYTCSIDVNDTSTLIDQRAVCLTAPKLTRTGIVNETPAISLGNLAANQSTSRDLDFALSEDMACGARIALDYRGAVDDGGFSETGELQILGAQLGGENATCNNTASCPAQPPAAVTPASGILYNAGRAGNGMEVQSVGNFLGLLWYTALPSHKPIWYFNAGRYQGNQVLSDLKRFQFGGQFTSGDPSSEVVGESIATWLDPQTALFLWDFGNGAFGEKLIWFQTDQGAVDEDVTRQWFNPDESGWGFVFNSQGNTDIQTMYIYDDDGDPVWLLNPNVYQGDVGEMRSFSNVHCPACPWTPALPNDAGSIEFDFSDPDAGTVSVDIDLPAPLNGVWNRNNMPIQPIQ